MKFGFFQSLAQKEEKKTLNCKGFFIKSKSFHCKYLKQKENKAIFIIKKKIGNSPTRNRIKRQIRAILSKKQLNNAIHIMIILKKEFLLTNFQQLVEEFDFVFNQIEKKIKH
ncbi:ribonuclease P protein component [Alphaproteobacteria bacterium endosymbiont of Tiliacea citrago]|uniref:ribonuclease P protein component n=1 Tax=Alphaproteobacteria bacterium endosymbiont of Tiliacea citrago TaxID=3077944 RepID=UPI00313E7C3F